MRFSMLYSGEQILSFKSCLVLYAGDSLSTDHAKLNATNTDHNLYLNTVTHYYGKRTIKKGNCFNENGVYIYTFFFYFFFCLVL